MIKLVTIPIAGNIAIEVTVEDGATDEDAIKAAWDQYGEKADKAGEVSWEAYDQIVEGNVFHGECNEVTVEDA